MQIILDPRISEWGNPAEEDSVTLPSSEQTQGTETSKYLEENKTKVIPKVVASEMGPSPNRRCLGNTGVVGLRHGTEDFEVERFGKIDHRG